MERTNPSFHNKRSLFQRIDALPRGPEWKVETMVVEGDIQTEDGNCLVEEVELWWRDPVSCVKELLGSRHLAPHLHFEPQKKFEDDAGQERHIDEFHTGDYMWKLQVSTFKQNKQHTDSRHKKDKLPDGATVAPVIISSDKTHLSVMSGDSHAWPVYLTLGNISKSVRRKPTMRAQILLAYLPVTKPQVFSKARRSLEIYRLFHRCMKRVLESLKGAGEDGEDILCADGFVRRVWPILAAYIADFPEQCLVSCCQENHCPMCKVPPDERGEPTTYNTKDQDDISDILQDHARGLKPREFADLGLRAVYDHSGKIFRIAISSQVLHLISCISSTRASSRTTLSNGAQKQLQKGKMR